MPTNYKPTFGNQPSGEEIQRAREAKQIMALMAMLSRAKLNDSEFDFLNRVQDNLDRYGDRTKVSVKQLAWLKDIKDKLVPKTVVQKPMEVKNMSMNDPRLIQGPGRGEGAMRGIPPVQQPPQQNIINMLNDMQLIALLASQMYNEQLGVGPKMAVTAAENILLEVVGRDMAHSTAHQQVRVDGCFKCAFLALKEHYDTAMQINQQAREKAARGE